MILVGGERERGKGLRDCVDVCVWGGGGYMCGCGRGGIETYIYVYICNTLLN